MAILTAKQTWRRRSPAVTSYAHLTAEERANVRRVVQHLSVQVGSHAKLARALGMTAGALTKQKVPGSAPSPRLAFAAARVAGVGVDDVLASRWIGARVRRAGRS